MYYHKRLENVNANCNDETKTVWDSIDRPMRPLIYEIHRIGLRTKFSCCGFNYEGEEEPKNHHAGGTYFFIFSPSSTNITQIYPFFSLVDMARAQGWSISYHGSQEWHFFYRNTVPNLYQLKEGENETIHDYEAQVLAIFNLTKSIRERISDANNFEENKIIDGNTMYQTIGVDEWQVKPKRTVVMKELKELVEIPKVVEGIKVS